MVMLMDCPLFVVMRFGLGFFVTTHIRLSRGLLLICYICLSDALTLRRFFDVSTSLFTICFSRFAFSVYFLSFPHLLSRVAASDESIGVMD